MIGKDLGVPLCPGGLGAASGDRMRVNAQLIDAGSSAHLWAEQFDTPRAQSVADAGRDRHQRLARAMDLQLVWAEGARIKRTLVANRDARDLALQCDAGTRTAGWIGKGRRIQLYALCEQALAIDPNNVRGTNGCCGIKFWAPAVLGVSGDPKGDLDRADELESKALALDQIYAWAHDLKGGVLRAEGRTEEAVAEHERALALDPSNVDAAAQLGIDYRFLGRFDKSLEYLDGAILASPYDPSLAYWYDSKAWANFPG